MRQESSGGGLDDHRLERGVPGPSARVDELALLVDLLGDRKSRVQNRPASREWRGGGACELSRRRESAWVSVRWREAGSWRNATYATSGGEREVAPSHPLRIATWNVGIAATPAPCETSSSSSTSTWGKRAVGGHARRAAEDCGGCGEGGRRGGASVSQSDRVARA